MWVPLTPMCIITKVAGRAGWLTHHGCIALRAKARGGAPPERCQDPLLGALSNRLLLAIEVYPRFEELTNMLEMHSGERL